MREQALADRRRSAILWWRRSWKKPGRTTAFWWKAGENACFCGGVTASQRCIQALLELLMAGNVSAVTARDVVEEYLTVNQHLSREVEGRLVVED